MTTAQELYHQIAAELPDAKEGKMFGALCIKAPNGKAVAMFWKDCMVFKLRGEAEKEAMSLDGVGLFNPMGNRPMGGWVQVPWDYSDRWREFGQAAMDYVRTL